MGPKWVRMGPTVPKMGPKWVRMGPKWVRTGPKCAQMGPRLRLGPCTVEKWEIELHRVDHPVRTTYADSCPETVSITYGRARE